MILFFEGSSEGYIIKRFILMKRLTVTGLISAVILFFFIQGIGCGTAKSVYRTVRPEKGKLKKRVLILPVTDRAGLGDAKIAQITDALMERLKEDKQLLVQRGPNPRPSARRMRSREFGVVVDPALMKSADELGMNVLITGVVNPFELHSRRRGIWPLQITRHKVEVSLLINAFDVIDGTLVLTHLEARKIKISGDDLEVEGNPPKIDEEKLEKALSRMVEDQAEIITEGLREQPWRGKVVSAEGESITINAGTDVGLTKDVVFEVFEMGDAIRSASGRNFYLLTQKVGEIKTVNVMETRASAVPLDGKQFRAGQIIKVKD